MAKLSLKDEALKKTIALPSAASSSVTTAAFRLKSGEDIAGGFYAECELEIDVPALSATILPATGKITIEVQTTDTDDATGWEAAETLTVKEIEGGTSGGSDAQEIRYRFPTGVKKYARVKASTNAIATDASSVTMTVWLVF
ncbi:MAG: hypothetical protein Q4D98_03465 [Planctomycetia bacterium]|nr:hypothetical protein [Planctomycetia bacterium]